MSNLVFDEKGNLHPYAVINSDLETFQKVFVTQREHSATRKRLFENYQVYTNDLIKIISTPFFQWIDGSFVTKKLNPGDIDVVTQFNMIEWQELFGYSRRDENNLIHRKGIIQINL